MATTPLPQDGHSATILTLTQQHREGQALQQYAYDPAVIDQAVMVGDMSKMEPSMRLAFYKAVCLSAGLNPLTQPFTVLKRQDGTTWLYANSVCTQQLAALHRVSFEDVQREHFTFGGEPLYCVRVTAVTPDGRRLPSQAVVSLTKKKREVAGNWPGGDPKFRDVLDADAEPVLIPLRGESLANSLMRADTKAFRRATLALVGLGWMLSDFEGRAVTFDVRTGDLQEEPHQVPRRNHLTAPAEQAKDTAAHIADLYGDQAVTPAGEAGAPYIAQIEAVILAHPGTNVEDSYRWAERQRHKTRQAFTVEDWQWLLEAVRKAAALRQPPEQSVPATVDMPPADDVIPSAEGPSWGPQSPDLMQEEERDDATEYGE